MSCTKPTLYTVLCLLVLTVLGVIHHMTTTSWLPSVSYRTSQLSPWIQNVTVSQNATHTPVVTSGGPRILCWVLTDSDLAKKTEPVRETWTQRCDKAIFMSSRRNRNFPMIGLGGSSGRSHLATKSKAAWKYVYEHHVNDFDYFLKADTDTYVIVENLKAYLRSRDPTKAEYFGHRFSPKFLNYIYMSGGPGLVISREALRKTVTEAFTTLPDCAPDGTGIFVLFLFTNTYL